MSRCMRGARRRPIGRVVSIMASDLGYAALHTVVECLGEQTLQM